MVKHPFTTPSVVYLGQAYRDQSPAAPNDKK
jgi:hypothetical protein